ncbi:MAG: V-type ATP synthase subunit E family protein [Candidatus Thermoplasmatota archaeon]
MPIEKIIERIEEETQDKIDNIIQRGKEEAEEIEEEIEKEKERKLDEIKKEKEREIKTMKNRIISQAKLETKKRKLNVREEMINEVFKEVKNRLGSKEPDEYRGYLKQSIREIDDILESEITVKCNPGSEDIVKRFTEKRNPDIKVESSLDTIGGIRALSERGSTVDLTFEANLERKRKELRKEISDILFRQEEED